MHPGLADIRSPTHARSPEPPTPDGRKSGVYGRKQPDILSKTGRDSAGGQTGFEGSQRDRDQDRKEWQGGILMATYWEIAGFLNHIAKHPEDFEIDEITEILKEAAEIIYFYTGRPAKEQKPELEDMDPSGSA
ncbi:MAG: hypothetical protein Kow0026_13430 [Oricola sp.]